jgi:hypothetical protein
MSKITAKWCSISLISEDARICRKDISKIHSGMWTQCSDCIKFTIIFIHWIFLFSKPGAPGCYNMKNEQALIFVYDLAKYSHEHSVTRREYGIGSWVGLQWFRYFRVGWQSLENDWQKGMRL